MESWYFPGRWDNEGMVFALLAEGKCPWTDIEENVFARSVAA